MYVFIRFQIKDGLVERMKEMKLGSVAEFDSFLSAVIDQRAYDRIVSYIETAKTSSELDILAGGRYRADTGFFVEPTLVETRNPRHRIMTEEIFGPVLTAYVYNDDQVDDTLKLVDESTSFALTGAIFGEDRQFMIEAAEKLKMSAGNFYINDKSTGAVVGQQPFGGSRLSGIDIYHI